MAAEHDHRWGESYFNTGEGYFASGRECSHDHIDIKQLITRCSDKQFGSR